MRCLILVVLLNALFTLLMYFAAPEMLGSTAYYVGSVLCALAAMIITWRDPPGMLDDVILFLFKWGIIVSGLAFFLWGIGYRLELWGDHNPDKVFSSGADSILLNLAVLSGVLILISGWVFWRRR